MTADIGQRFVRDLEKDTAQLVQSIQSIADDHASTSTLSYPDGISLLSLKSDALLSYLHHLVLLISHRLRGHSLSVSPGADMVKNLVHLRLVLEKARPLEGRLKYQIEKLHRAVEEEDREVRAGRASAAGNEEEDEDIDPLSFRPNPLAMSTVNARGGREAQAAAALAGDSDSEADAGGVRIYRPPKAMPVVYDGDAPRGRRSRGSPSDALDETGAETGVGGAPRIRGRSSALLADLSAGLSSNPFESSSAGLGTGGSSRTLNAASSSKARKLRALEDYEEENYTRVFMGKKDSKRRRRDEEEVALGGAGQSSSQGAQGRLGAGMEGEFGDLLRTHERERGGGSAKRRRPEQASDAYDVLRKAGRADRGGTLQRARRAGGGASGDDGRFGTAGADGGGGANAFKKAKKSFARKEKSRTKR